MNSFLNPDKRAISVLEKLFGLENWRVERGSVTANFIPGIPLGTVGSEGDHSADVFAAVLKDYGISSIHRADRIGIAIENTPANRAAINLLEPKINEVNYQLVSPPRKDTPSPKEDKPNYPAIVRDSIIQKYVKDFSALGNSPRPLFFDEGQTTTLDKPSLRIQFKNYDAAALMEDILHKNGMTNARFIEGSRVPQVALGLDDLNSFSPQIINEIKASFDKAWKERNQNVAHHLGQLHGLQSSVSLRDITDQFVLCATDLTEARLYTDGLRALGFSVTQARQKVKDNSGQHLVRDVVLIDDSSVREAVVAGRVERVNRELILSVLNTTVPVLDKRAGEWVFVDKDGVSGYQNTSSYLSSYASRYAEAFNRSGVPAEHSENTVFIAQADAQTFWLTRDARIGRVITSFENIVSVGIDMPTRYQTVPAPRAGHLRN
jgi:hypothetical protein